MFQSEELKNHLQSSSTIKLQSLVAAEWNLNLGENISIIGNYRYRPLDGVSTKYGILTNTYDPEDDGYFYTGATDADIVLDGTYDEDENLTLLKTSKEKESSLFSLESCFERFRPRSGINKLRYGVNTKFLNYSNSDLASRPRYYMPDKNDKFKYWSSYRTESYYKYSYNNGSVSYGPESTFVDLDGTVKNGLLSGSRERGIATRQVSSRHYIDDAAPFIVYKDQIPANRIVVKMQTNVGTVRLNDAITPLGSFSDPFYGYSNQTTPTIWKIQYLLNNTWIDAVSFDESSTRSDGSNVIGPDGYVEISYGILVPEIFKDIFNYLGSITSRSLLPTEANEGDSFLLKSSDQDLGQIFIWTNGGYSTFTPTYGWSLHEENISKKTNFVSTLANPESYTIGSQLEFREFAFIQGIRIVVDTMNKPGSTLDIIEMSPRLTADISDMVTSFSLSKTASDIGVSGLPVGQLLASNGSMEMFDPDQVFNKNNPYSIVSKYITQNLQIKFYEVIKDVSGVDYYVPLKTMYASEMPIEEANSRTIAIDLRDALFYFESHQAPALILPNVSLSYAVSVLLDYIGFSNYSYYITEDESEPTIPFFFVDPQLSVAEVLQQLAVSTQTAMFFDEYNNFVMMSKNYIMPSLDSRGTDIVLYGSSDFAKNGAYRNAGTSYVLSNIVSLAQQDNNVYNNGKISYTTRYIQKSTSSISEAYKLDKDRRWVYKPSLLWEVSASENTKSINEQTATSQAYSLSAIPLNSDLTAEVPYVDNHTVVNNIMDLGEAVYWLGRYNGYFYANGEIIKFDAVEYSVTGIGNNIWVSSVSDYQKYFSKIPFNGKMYPTGRVRIFSEPNYEIVEGDVSRMANGPVAKHGRGQFGTTVTSHSAGINSYWTSSDNVRGCSMEAGFLFGAEGFDPAMAETPSDIIGGYAYDGTLSTSKAKRSYRSGVIKNFMSSTYSSEASSVQQSDTVQASALVFEGPTFTAEEKPINFISYVSKKVSDENNVYRHFGTRMRVVGKIESNEKSYQAPAGATTVYNIASNDPETSAKIDGAGGGLAVLLNPKTNTGYYFEIMAINASDPESYDTEYGFDVNNVFFYKIGKKETADDLAAPIKLWSGLSNIIVDSGTFVGQERVFAQETQTVYDLAVEYENIGTIRRFYLFLNGTQIATVDDLDPLPQDECNSMALFVRGSARCMFENIYAIRNNHSKNASTLLEPVVANAFSANQISINDSFSKYSISGLIQSTYLSGISPSDSPQYNIYYDEFGTIMREAAYFNINYDKAYPALTATISPVVSKLRGYTVSGFFAGAYGAEFLVFNATDTTLLLDEKSGNYLRIQGIAFTQNSSHDLTVDEFFNKKSSLSNQEFSSPDNYVISPNVYKELYQDIKYSRIKNGNKEFSLEANYIQDQDSANELMGWLSSKIMRERKSVGLQIFANPAIQLGDIVEIEYVSDNVNIVADSSMRFVVYNIEYTRSPDGPEMTIYLSEV